MSGDGKSPRRLSRVDLRTLLVSGGLLALLSAPLWVRHATLAWELASVAGLLSTVGALWLCAWPVRPRDAVPAAPAGQMRCRDAAAQTGFCFWVDGVSCPVDRVRFLRKGYGEHSDPRMIGHQSLRNFVSSSNPRRRPLAADALAYRFHVERACHTGHASPAYRAGIRITVAGVHDRHRLKACDVTRFQSHSAFWSSGTASRHGPFSAAA